ncbi:hypothetical protein CDAR_478141 [Caerostris darwini]|uniref:Uncharacterized protein n=1 Tax=Caerostris darwini TaxID=1538125 RepID=A0AAV4UJZ7_9ARAC|nr:hypothetical protein CDAR_478141 [Caerostris darwini]
MCYPVPGPFQTPFPIAGTDATGEPDYNEGLFTRFEDGGGLGDGSAPSLSGHTSELANCSKQAIGIKNANIEDTSRKDRTNIKRTQPLNMCYPVPGPFQTAFLNAGADATGEPDYNEGLFTPFEEGGGQGVGATTVAPHP